MPKTQVLAVDLDGTLIRSDMLFETFWAAISKNCFSFFSVALSLRRGRAALKAKLSTLGVVDVRLLPYNQDVLAYVNRWRANGGRTSLVTASNQANAEAIAEHLGIFDEVYGSDEHLNLKGRHKADFLLRTYGAGNFAYVGDSRADLPVWSNASSAITVNLGRRPKARVERLGAQTTHIGSKSLDLLAHWRALRPQNWPTNVLVFLPMLAARDFSPATLIAAALAFISFNLINSSVHLLNDLLDLSTDRADPRKCFEPVASSSVSIVIGTLMMPCLLFAGFALAVSLGRPLFLVVTSVYYVVTVGYSRYSRARDIIGICVLVGLYMARVVAGAAATGIWILI